MAVSVLVEFVLARIADDEARVQDSRPPRLAWIRWDDTHTAEERVLADCAVKRRVVQACADALLEGKGKHSDRDLAMSVLRGLALIDSDHPDFPLLWIEP